MITCTKLMIYSTSLTSVDIIDVNIQGNKTFQQENYLATGSFDDFM